MHGIHDQMAMTNEEAKNNVSHQLLAALICLWPISEGCPNAESSTTLALICLWPISEGCPNAESSTTLAYYQLFP